MKSYILTALITAMALTGCTKKEEVAETKVATETLPTHETEKKSAGFEAFPMPENIHGCSCYFSSTEESFMAGNYVYVDDYGNQAQVKINGKTETFQMQEGDFLPDNFNKKLENPNYLLEIKGKKIADDPERLRFQGTIKATDKKTKQEFTTPIVGECAC